MIYFEHQSNGSMNNIFYLHNAEHLYSVNLYEEPSINDNRMYVHI